MSTRPATATGGGATTNVLESENPGPIQVDDALEDADSAIASTLSSYTRPLTSSALDYPIEHGRRYHAFRPGSYSMPNDQHEMDRLDLMHEVFTRALGRQLHLAPIDLARTHRVLDMGTGTGIWALDFADQHPGIEVLGNDLSPIQPFWIPPNVKFEVDDIESPWSYHAPFDFIFSRYLVSAIRDWPSLVRNVFDNLRPGGWVEFQDYEMMVRSDDGTLTEQSSTHKWIHLEVEATLRAGREPNPGPQLEGWVRDAGFVNITHRVFKLPLGAWPKDKVLKEIGLFNLMACLYGLEAFSLRLMCDVLGWDEPQVHALVAQVRSELKTQRIHGYNNFHVVYAQKPY
ncbi:secondary metabolism regulator LAE1 [Echria macrotheca]|uniref:Secondary metabolism regulator LAE1 n=1 Tax=Echria macrotheca TaxID=438768 RepID=A0AAJ0BLM3_9PEZI|nr:secondary metabolism regulator LAE1 [Echria macrotheca]